MSIKYTPGPWHSNGVRVICENSERSNTSICICVPNFTKDDSCYANAQLISAAPEMLEALREFVGAVDAGTKFADLSVLQAAHKAIAKAEGRS